MGNNEFLIGYSRAETKSVNEIAEFIEDHRKPFSDGRVASIGAAAMASAEVWQKIAEESDAAAKRELLKDSSELAELNKLERAAAEAKRLADAKQDELTRAWNEYNSLPEKAKAISLKLAQFDNTLRELEPEVLEKGYKDTFRSMLNGARVQYADRCMEFRLLSKTTSIRPASAPLRRALCSTIACQRKTPK